MNLGDGGCSKPGSHHWTPAWATERDAVFKTKTKQLERQFLGWIREKTEQKTQILTKNYN